MRSLKHFAALLLALCLLAACASFNEEHLFNNARVSESRTLTEQGLTLRLNFMDAVQLSDGTSRPWNNETMAPYLAAASRWLRVVHGVKGLEHHTLTINIHVADFRDGNGMATIDYDSLKQVGENWFPTQGWLVINNELYDPEFADEEQPRGELSEFDANISHEMGHIFGIGCLWQIEDREGRVVKDMVSEMDGGNVIRNAPNTIAVYNFIFDTQLDFLPISDDGGHFYDSQESEDRHHSGRWVQVHSASYDLMANGCTLTPLSVAMLDDLGWLVSYDEVGAYRF